MGARLWKSPDGKNFRLYRPYCYCHKYATLQKGKNAAIDDAQMKWKGGLYPHKILFTKTGFRPDLAYGYSMPTPTAKKRELRNINDQ